MRTLARSCRNKSLFKVAKVWGFCLVFTSPISEKFPACQMQMECGQEVGRSAAPHPPPPFFSQPTNLHWWLSSGRDCGCGCHGCRWWRSNLSVWSTNLPSLSIRTSSLSVRFWPGLKCWAKCQSEKGQQIAFNLEIT